MERKLLKVSEVSQIINSTDEHVRSLIRDGYLPCVRLGRLVRVDEQKLNEWINSGGQCHPGGWRRRAEA